MKSTKSICYPRFSSHKYSFFKNNIPFQPQDDSVVYCNLKPLNQNIFLETAITLLE